MILDKVNLHRKFLLAGKGANKICQCLSWFTVVRFPGNVRAARANKAYCQPRIVHIIWHKADAVLVQTRSFATQVR